MLHEQANLELKVTIPEQNGEASRAYIMVPSKLKAMRLKEEGIKANVRAKLMEVTEKSVKQILQVPSISYKLLDKIHVTYSFPFLGFTFISIIWRHPVSVYIRFH